MTTPAAVPFSEALRYWFKLGCISFGGPAGQIALMQHELVERRRWISEGRFLHALNYCMVLPGPEAQQLATYLGWLMHRTWGGIAAGVLFVLPSMLLLMLLAWVYVKFGQTPVIAGILYGIKPAVVALVLAAAWRVASKALKHPVLWAIAFAAFVALAVFNIAFPWVILAAALIGLALERFAPHTLKGGSGHAKSKAATHTPALIDDDTPPPAHAMPTMKRATLVIIIGTSFWLAAWALARAIHPELPRMGLFFTQAALLTFGGAYAVLPYVFQGAVEHHQWLTAAQMMDGLALGESTPGPLIMVVTFVGYLAGVTKQVTADPLLSGIVAAFLVTVFTFLPSFIFILLGGPMVEHTRNLRWFSAPLTAITAAVVGVITSLALFFAVHTFWPRYETEGLLPGGVDWLAVALALVCAVALIRFKVNTLWVIAGAALAGLLIRTFT